MDAKELEAHFDISQPFNWKRGQMVDIEKSANFKGAGHKEKMNWPDVVESNLPWIAHTFVVFFQTIMCNNIVHIFSWWYR